MSWTNPPTDAATEETLQIGDVTSLIIGGPEMVVIDTCAECGMVDVAWIDSDGDVAIERFAEEVLV